MKVKSLMKPPFMNLPRYFHGLSDGGCAKFERIFCLFYYYVQFNELNPNAMI
jgi:hypothetical protein